MNKLLVVGCGSIGRRHISNFKAAGIEDIAGVDMRWERLSQARQLGLSAVYEDYRKALEADRFDAVVIAVPPHLHTKIAIAAAEQGCHLFIEKPLADSTEGCDTLMEICQRKGLVCLVGYGYRFIPSIIMVKEMLNSERIGRVLSARLEFSSYLPDWHPWEDYREFYMAKKEQGGGALLDESHGVDLLRWFLGEVKTVHAVVDHVSGLEITSDDLASLLLRFESGVLAEAHFDLLGRAPRIQLELIGSSGTILWDRIDHKVQLYDPERKRWETYNFTDADYLSMYVHEAEHFVACVRGDAQPLVDLSDARKTLEVLLAAFESSESRRTIDLVSSYQ